MIVINKILVRITVLVIFFLFGGSMGTAQQLAAARVMAATNSTCTLYVAANGSAESPGTSPTNPLSLKEAIKRVQPGDVVCLLDGTYILTSPLYLNRSGIPSAWIVYRSYGNTAKIVWDGSIPDDMVQITAGTRYIEINNLNFDGNNEAYTAIKCNNGSHVRAVNNRIYNTGSSGILSYLCDYITIDRNEIYHIGYGAGWGSGISLNSSMWFDQAPGFHSFVVNNIIAGTYDNSDHHSDGNGIITDRGDNNPSVLIANNIVYQNGGRCIHTYLANNDWFVNNTCFSNSLDSQLGNGTGSVGEFSILKSANTRLINNVVYAWTKGYAYYHWDPIQFFYYRNMYYGGLGLRRVPQEVSSDPNQIRMVDPLFVDPIPLDPTADRQYNNALPPDQLGVRLHPREGSPLIDAGIDPRSVPGITPELAAGLAQYVLTDRNGISRPQGPGFDIGAYEYSQQEPRRLHLSTSGSGIVTGPTIICSGTCVAEYPEGTPVGLNANPDDGWHFAGWEGACAGQENPCRLLMTSDIVVKANFERGDIRIQGLQASNNGPTPVDTFTTLTATIDAGSNVTFSWDFGDGNHGIGATITHKYLAPGTYHAVVRANNPLGSSTATTIVTVFDPYPFKAFAPMVFE